MLNKEIEKVDKKIEVSQRRVGGEKYKVKVDVSKERRKEIEIRWIINDDRGSKEKKMVDRMQGEMIDEDKNRGYDVKKSEEKNRMDEEKRELQN